MRPSPLIRQKARGGFSLVELLVSMAVLVILVGLLAQMLNQATQIWNQGESNKERLQDLRALADFMGNELQGALLPINRTSIDNLEFVVNPEGAEQFKFRDSVFWQCPLATDQSSGDVAEIGYFVRWDETNPANPRPILCRFYADPTSEHFLIYSKPTTWTSENTIEAVAPGDKEHNYTGLFAENVLGLWVDCIDKDGNVISTAGEKWSSRPPEATPQPPCTLPVAIDLGLVMIDSRSAKRLTPSLKETLVGQYTGSTSAEEFVTKALGNPSLRPISPGLRYYQTRIYLQNSR